MQVLGVVRVDAVHNPKRSAVTLEVSTLQWKSTQKRLGTATTRFDIEQMM